MASRQFEHSGGGHYLVQRKRSGENGARLVRVSCRFGWGMTLTTYVFHTAYFKT